MEQGGQVQFGGTKRFAIRRQLGAGGMGVVYEALDREQHATVALKTLYSASPDAILRLKREFRALQDIQHKNLVTLGELFEEAGTWFFTMELVHGCGFLEHVRPRARATRVGLTGDSTSVSDSSPTALRLHEAIVSRRRPPSAATPLPPSGLPAFDEDRLRDALAQLARGLIALHAAGRIHRDVKPSNILVEQGGRVVLLDFGLVTEAERGGSGLTGAHVVGTAAYMAPEQGLGRPVGPEADWYAVGVVLFEALAGDVPFDGSNLQVLMAKQHQRAVRASALAGGVPEDLDDLCAQLLEHDPARRPTGEAVLRALGARLTPSVVALAPRARASTNTTAPPFVGRERELAFLHGALDDVRAGRQISAFVHGESGIGKSSLLRRFAEIACGDEHVVVLAGRCHEREAMPYKAMDGVIDALARYMQRLPKHEAAALLPRRASVLLQAFPVLKRVDVLADSPLHDAADPQELRMRVFVALRELFGRLADRRTIIVTIDDLQWADADGLALLAELTRPPDAPTFLLLGSWREAEGETAGVRERLEAFAGATRFLPLTPLGEGAACELARRLLTRATESDKEVSLNAAANIAREATGHPLFIDELVRDRVAERDDFEITGTGGGVRLEDVLWKRIERLDDACRKVLEVIAVAGAPIDQESAARAADMDLAAFGRHAGLLRVVNLVRTTGARGLDVVETYHDRVRVAVIAHLDATTRRARHRDLARALDASGRADPEALVEHYLGAGEPERAGRQAVVAAEAAARALAFDQAAELYQQALALLPENDPLRRGASLALGAALANAGRGADAAHVFLACASSASPAQALDLRQRAAHQLLITGHFDDGVATVRAVLSEEGLAYPETHKHALATILLNRAWLRLHGLRFRERDETRIPAKDLMRLDACFQVGFSLSMADTVRGQAFNARGLRLALTTGEPYRLARALALEAVSYVAVGGRARRRGQACFDAAERLATRLAHPHALALVVAARGNAAFLEGRFRDAVELCARAESELREHCIGAHWEINVTQLWTCRALQYQGEMGLLAQRVGEFLSDVTRRGDLFAATSFQLTAAASLHLAADDVRRARADVADALRRWSLAGYQLQHYYADVALAHADLYQGRGDLAYAAVREAWPKITRAFLMRIQFVRLVMLDLRARAALAVAAGGTSTGEKRRLLAEVARDARRIERERTAWATPLAQLLRGGIAAVEGREDGARAWLAEAAGGFDAADMALHAASARLAFGKLSGSDDGKRVVGEARAAIVARGVRRPDRFAAMLAPFMPA